jgi:hypothetical protein
MGHVSKLTVLAWSKYATLFYSFKVMLIEWKHMFPATAKPLK